MLMRIIHEKEMEEIGKGIKKKLLEILKKVDF